MSEGEIEVLERQQLETLLATSGPRIRLVAIDGHPGSGKSTLASSLAQFLEGGLLSTDDYVIKERDGERYADLLDAKQLRDDFSSLRQENSMNIIEGVCLRETLAMLQASPDLAVYCKRITQAGRWADDPDLNDYPERPRDSPGWLDGVVHNYHLREHPHRRAEVIVEYHADVLLDDIE